VFAREFNENAESYEGMYVRFPRQMAVTDTFNQHRFGEVWLGEKGVVEQPTNEYPVGSDSAELAADGMARSVLLDDSSTRSNPDPVPYTRADGTLRLGDTVNPLTGAINYSFGNYRIQPQEPASVKFVPQNARPGELRTYGNLVVASANVLNYWTTLGGRGADTPDQLAVQTEKLVAELIGTGADIIGLQEIENDPANTPILTLVDELNAAEGEDVWSWIGEHEANVYPIRNEIIYRNDLVEPVGDPVTVIDPIFDTIPPGRSDPVGRRPVAQTFMFNGESFTVISNHLKSKGCSGASGLDTDQGDGQSCFNATRVGQAERVLELVDDLVAATGDPDVIVLGDMNSYLYEDPILALETELVNLVREWDKDPYSYNFFAGFAAPWIGRGLLDYAFATQSMADQVKKTEVWHINADEPRFLDWFDTDTVAPGPYRASDHDPVIVSLKIK
jgi:predicted extracellular nuclease